VSAKPLMKCHKFNVSNPCDLLIFFKFHVATSHSTRVLIAGNLDPALHPFAKEREYTRALNATKLGKLFAKPFVAALSGHLDGVYCLRRHVCHL
jgi:hypothetical protein